MLNIAVLVSGGGTNLQAILDDIDGGKITNTSIKAVISNKKDAYALKRAEAHGIRTAVIPPKDYTDRQAFGQALIDELKACGAEFIVLAGYLVIIPEVLIKQFPNKIINIHPSLIPSFCGAGYYGLKVHEAVLDRGLKITGATVHFVDEGTDTGPIFLQEAVRVKQDDTPEVLQKRVMEEAEWKILPKAIDLIANDRVEIFQNHVRIKES